MGIVLKWNFKNLFADIPRLVLTLLSIASTFALLCGTGLALSSFVETTGTINEGLPYYVGKVGPPVVLFAFAVSMYVFFSVSIAGQEKQYWLMRSYGCTSKQYFYALLAEAVTLAAAGGIPGIGLGCLIAKIQFSSIGRPIVPGAYFFSMDALYGLLPAFLLIPLTMLAANLPLFLQRKEKKRKKTKHERAAFRTRRFPALFGAGGRLEYALGKNEHRHRVIIMFSVVVNLAVLFLFMAGVSVLSVSETGLSGDIPVYVYCNGTKDFDLAFSFDEKLTALKQNGLCGDFTYDITVNPLMTITQTETLHFPDERQNRMDVFSGSGLFYSPAYRLNENESLLAVPLVFLSEHAYEALADEAHANPAARCGILLTSEDRLNYASSQNVGWLCSQPESIRLQTVPASLWQQLLTSESEEDEEPLLSIPLSLLSEKSSVTIDIPIGGTVSGIDLYCPAVYLPEAAEEEYLTVLRGKENVFAAFSATLPSDRTETLAAELKKAFQADDCVVTEVKFGDHASGYSKMEDEPEIPEGTVIEIRDYTTFDRSANTFIEQAEQFFFRYFTVMVFLSIGLSIVNIVYMNRLSRRRENAILTSVGLDERQRMGMRLYESFRFTAWAVGGGAVLLVFLARLLIGSADNAYTGDNFSSAFEWKTAGWEYGSNDVFRQLLSTAANLSSLLKPYFLLIVFVVLFLFFGYLLTEYLVGRRFAKDELIPTLKDDMHE